MNTNLFSNKKKKKEDIKMIKPRPQLGPAL